MSRNRGRRYELLLAEYLQAWWPHAECPPPSRPGTDVLGTPGVVWENKTAKAFEPKAFAEQAKRHAIKQSVTSAELDALPEGCLCGRVKNLRTGLWDLISDHGCPVHDIPVVVYWPQGVGEANAGNTLAIVPLKVMVRLLKEAGY